MTQPPFPRAPLPAPSCCSDTDLTDACCAERDAYYRLPPSGSEAAPSASDDAAAYRDWYEDSGTYIPEGRSW